MAVTVVDATDWCGRFYEIRGKSSFDLLNDRGMMGDGVIDIPKIRGWVEAQGFAGHAEVEIFSNRWCKQDHGTVLDLCIDRHRSVV